MDGVCVVLRIIPVVNVSVNYCRHVRATGCLIGLVSNTGRNLDDKVL